MSACTLCGGYGMHHDPIAHGAGGFCSCGGELLDWCDVHGDWVCDDCGCVHCREDDRLEAMATGLDPQADR